MCVTVQSISVAFENFDFSCQFACARGCGLKKSVFGTDHVVSTARGQEEPYPDDIGVSITLAEDGTGVCSWGL